MRLETTSTGVIALMVGAVSNCADAVRLETAPTGGHSADFSLPGSRGLLTSPIGNVSLILKSTINTKV